MTTPIDSVVGRAGILRRTLGVYLVLVLIDTPRWEGEA